MKNKFIVIVTVYNSVDYIERCLESIISQDYNNLEICVIDDCSTDGTWDRILKLQNSSGGRMNICRNEYNLRTALANIVKGIELFVLDDEDIICTVDGDDSLIGTTVISDINAAYQDKDVYMTYGQYIPESETYGPFCKPVANTDTYRKSGEWCVSHLRTCKKKIWDKIRDDDLRDDNGDYYKSAGDAAILFPLVELCGHKHMRFIEKVNYLYNDLNPLNEMKICKGSQLGIAQAIRNKPCYTKIDTL